jgi:hypothetical protein
VRQVVLLHQSMHVVAVAVSPGLMVTDLNIIRLCCHNRLLSTASPATSDTCTVRYCTVFVLYVLMQGMLESVDKDVIPQGSLKLVLNRAVLYCTALYLYCVRTCRACWSLLTRMSYGRELRAR